MPKMRAVPVLRAKGPFELQEREIPQPRAGEVRIKVEACGICHSDSLTKEGLWPGIQFPRVPGHEIAGVIDALGADVPEWRLGQRVGIGWFGARCGYCESCRRGDFITCATGKTPGISYDGGYADYVVVPYPALASMPEGISAADAAPLMCAGITTFNSLRHSGARGGDLVAVLGIGGLGHLGVQFAAKMGMNTVAIARGRDKEELARKLGARHYIDSSAQNVAEELMKLGGAKVVLGTATSGKAMADTIEGLGIDGKLIVLGASFEPMPVNALALLGKRRSIQGWPSGTSKDSEDTLRFSMLTGVRPMIEEYPLERAAEAYERMMSGQAKFRVVLKP
ncbi:MAG TPA: alcohol dehydrogenase [Terriglobales bacterium]|nr:alcohol dehydrogenase [Terriglobales bacterium]